MDIMEVKTVVNELLSYTLYKYTSDTMDSIRDVVINFYGPEAISDAKTCLWRHYDEVLPVWENRRNTGNRSLKEKEVEDILKAMRTIDEHFSTSPTLPTQFVAANLANLPPLGPVIQPVVSDELNSRMTRMEEALQLIVKSLPRDHGVQVQSTPGYEPLAVAPVATTNTATTATTAAIATTATTSDTTPFSYADSLKHTTGLTVKLPPLRRSSPKDSSTASAIIATVTASKPAEPGGNYETVARKRRRPTAIYGTKKGGQVLAGPRRQEIFLFHVARECTEDVLSKYICDSNADTEIAEIERVSKQDAWTHSYRILIKCTNDVNFIDPELWPQRMSTVFQT